MNDDGVKMLVLIVIVVLCACSFLTGYESGEKSMQVKAVKNNVAEWHIVNDEGAKAFRWKTEKQDDK